MCLTIAMSALPSISQLLEEDGCTITDLPKNNKKYICYSIESCETHGNEGCPNSRDVRT